MDRLVPVVISRGPTPDRRRVEQLADDLAIIATMALTGREAARA